MSKKLYIFIAVGVIAAALLIGGAALLFVKNPEQQMIAATAVTGKVVAPPEMTSCAPGERCIVVDMDCNYCCDYVAINSAQEAAFDKLFNKSCRKVQSQTCSCFDLSSYPSCEAGSCRLIKWPD